MTKPTEKTPAPIPTPKKEQPLTGAARDRALKAGTPGQYVDKTRKPPSPSTIQWQPKRGKS